MSEHTWTMVAEGKCIKKRPSDNYNNQSFEKELAMRNEMDNEEKIKDSKILISISIQGDQYAGDRKGVAHKV